MLQGGASQQRKPSPKRAGRSAPAPPPPAEPNAYEAARDERIEANKKRLAELVKTQELAPPPDGKKSGGRGGGRGGGSAAGAAGAAGAAERGAKRRRESS